MMLLYADTGVGKSVTTIQTAPDPILYIMAEGRDVTKMLKAANRPGVKINFAFYEGWDDAIQMFNTPSIFEAYRSIVIDSLSHLISICLSDEILEESYESMESKKKTEKDLTMRVKMSQEGYGTLAGQMLRFTNLATKLSAQGKVVICIARSESHPKFDRSLVGAPALKGNEYSKHFTGFFDFIGYCERRMGEDGKIAYPPYVSFESDGSFMAKWTGIMPPGGVYHKVLDIDKILKASRGLL